MEFRHEDLITSTAGLRSRNPQRGDVIVLRYPKDPTQFFIKRVIGLPGEKSALPQLRGPGGHVYIFNSHIPKALSLASLT